MKYRFNYHYGSKDGEPILSLNDWQEAFIRHDSKGLEHWKSGRSAQSLAEDFMNESGEIMIFQIIEQLTGKKIHNSPIDAVIEYGSTFDNFKRPRIQDLAITGKLGEDDDNNTSFFVGIEAKVDEPFSSKTLKQQETYIKALKEKGKSTNAGERLKSLKEDFLSDIKSEEELNKVRYQLLYYLAGSFRANAQIIFMPIVVYKTKGLSQRPILYNEKKGKNNKKDYEQFVSALGFEQVIGVHIDGVEECEVHTKIIKAPSIDSEIQEKQIYTCYIVK